MDNSEGHPLYIAMTRAPEFLGMPRDYVIFALVVAFIPFMVTKSFILLFVALIIAYVALRLIIKFDPHMLSILNGRFVVVGMMPNHKKTKGNAYEL